MQCLKEVKKITVFRSETKYLYNHCQVKQFGLPGDYARKLTFFKCIRNSMVEGPDDRVMSAKGTVNDFKLEDNLSRAKARIIELAWCNPWDYFVTLTLDPQKYDRQNLKNFRQDLSQWLRDYSKKINSKIDYLLIPEKHKDGAWHMHGFIKGLPKEYLREFTLEEKLPHYLRTKIKENQAQFDWDDYRKKFGYINCETIKNHKAVSKYVMKYITKDMSRSVSEANMHLYYCSKNLNRAELIAKGTMSANMIPKYDFENEYVAIMWLEKNVPLDDIIIPQEITRIKLKTRHIDSETGEIT